MTAASPLPKNSITHGDCVDVMATWPGKSVDLILTDPPYLVRYKDRSGRSILNDTDGDWLEPAFAEMYRLLKPGSFCISFYGWNAVEQFSAAWRKAGFRIAGHIVFRKSYGSSAHYMQRRHEQAYLLVKGRATVPEYPIPDVLDWHYSGNRLHPTQKPVAILEPLIRSFTKPCDLVLDPFSGSGSTLVAAHKLGRAYAGIELDATHFRTASERMQRRAA